MCIISHNYVDYMEQTSVLTFMEVLHNSKVSRRLDLIWEFQHSAPSHSMLLGSQQVPQCLILLTKLA